ncbi:GATA transcription factor 1, partial [Tetrabaena socialis]
TDPSAAPLQVAWYERRFNLDGVGCEREVVALEEAPSVNPIGCISGKCFIAKAVSKDEAERLADGDGMEVFFCRGVFQQQLNSFMPYPELGEDAAAGGCKRSGKRQPGVSEMVADSEDAVTQKRVRYADEQAAAPVRRTGKLVSGRTCVECGATQTPQWREGPAGPKTLCNACGVRYVRAQQRASKRAVALGLSRSACGSGGRQSRAPKGAKADAARCSPVRAAPSDAPPQQRPSRQAALLAANKTAQYARTGVFPQSAMDIQPYGSVQATAAVQHQQQHHNHHHAADASSGGSGGGAVCGSAPTAAAHALSGTPDCSPFHDPCGSEQEGVTVEVVVGSTEGDADCCGAASASAAGAPAAAGDACAYPLPASCPQLPPPFASFLAASSAGALGEGAAATGLALAASPVLVAVAMGVPGRDAMVPVLPLPSAPPATHALACHPHGALLGGGGGGLLRMSSDALRLAASNPNGCVLLAPGHHSHRDLCGAAERAASRGSGGGGGCTPSLSGGSLGLAAAACCDDHPTAPLVVSVPVSPTSARVGGYAAVYDAAGLGTCAEAEEEDARMEEAFGGGCLHEHHHHRLQLQLHMEGCGGGGGMLQCGGGVEDEFGPLVEAEVDFGLGADGGMGLGGGDEGLFDE